MQTKSRILAIFGAIAITGLTFVAAPKGLGAFITWIDRLSSGERIAFRLLCLTVPSVVLPLALTLRRRRQRQEEAATIERTGLSSASGSTAVRADVEVSHF